MNYANFKFNIIWMIFKNTASEGEENRRVDFLKIVTPRKTEKIYFKRPIYIKDGLIEKLNTYLSKKKGYPTKIVNYDFYLEKAPKKLAVCLYNF